MKSQLIELLETFGYPVFLQGSLNSENEYPDTFFTFWDFDNPESVEKIPEQARQMLRANGWTVGGKPTDISVDKATHTGAMFTAYNIENYESEV